MKEGDSVYKVFSGLEDFLKQNKITLRTSAAEALPDFDEAMQDVRQIPHDREPVRRTKRKPAAGPREPDGHSEMTKALRGDEPFNVTNLPEYMEGYAEGVNPFTMDKLRGGEFSVERTLDLHGFHIDDAENLFAAFLDGAIRDGLRCIKVIHGRGLKSRHRPVLKESLKTWIIRAMNRRWIVAFASARMADGGTGAIYVLLKGRPVKRRIHVIG
jgi:DNA-nicking Smr family endonuclease